MSSHGVIADIGGTNARFALVDSHSNISQTIKLPVKKYARFIDALKDYLSQIQLKDQPKHLLIDVAGPINGDYFQFTNSHWSFSIEEIKEKIGLEYFKVMNDFAAIGCSLSHFTKADFISVNNKIPTKTGPKIILGPGTGLGAAFTIPHQDQWIFLPSEGGHMTMAAENEIEADILAYLRKKLNGHVSAERVISGQGLENIYEALWHIKGGQNFTNLSAPEITRKALDENDELCQQAALQFCSFLGAIAGSMSLMLLPYNGVYIAGGIIPQMLPLFKQSDFIHRFESKGRHGHINQEIPVYLITHPIPAFPGLAAIIAENLKK